MPELTQDAECTKTKNMVFWQFHEIKLFFDGVLNSALTASILAQFCFSDNQFYNWYHYVYIWILWLLQGVHQHLTRSIYFIDSYLLVYSAIIVHSCCWADTWDRQNFETSYLPFLSSKQSAFQIFLAGQDELSNLKSVWYSIGELLNVLKYQLNTNAL